MLFFVIICIQGFKEGQTNSFITRDILLKIKLYNNSLQFLVTFQHFVGFFQAGNRFQYLTGSVKYWIPFPAWNSESFLWSWTLDPNPSVHLNLNMISQVFQSQNSKNHLIIFCTMILWKMWIIFVLQSYQRWWIF